ncbi:phenylalanine--tRNA ligase beta subunit-related protein [Sporomusa aerivorans]|uniref:phenylalanine--tRNA ligase beta subunit-related protein n=1 Tax=Sporomusa aerivorans TaxID=204936 RepID=UPI00352BA60F
MLNVTDAWRKAYPEASVGIMVINNVLNPAQNKALAIHRQALLEILGAKFSDQKDLNDYSPIKAYNDYYKRYGKTYHVKQQIESVVFKGKKIPDKASLVEAMFMAELKNCLLTAGHDYTTLKMPITLNVAKGSEKYTLINEREQQLKQEDMFMQDNEGIISSIIYGPDLRTRIKSSTQKAAFFIYAPPGITQKEISDHLSDIYTYVASISAMAKIELQQIFRN